MGTARYIFTMSSIYSYEQFLVFVDWEFKRLKNNGEDVRYGQVYFNTLWEFRPNIANKIRATKMDPFHKNEVHPLIHNHVKIEWMKMNAQVQAGEIVGEDN